MANIKILTQDITERRRAEDALQRSEQHFRALIENASDIITVLDGDGTIRYESPSLERVLGYKPEELIGKNVLELVHPDDVPGVIDTFAQPVQGQVVFEPGEVRFRHKDGSYRFLAATGCIYPPVLLTY